MKRDLSMMDHNKDRSYNDNLNNNPCWDTAPFEIWNVIMSFIPFGYHPFIRTTNKTIYSIALSILNETPKSLWDIRQPTRIDNQSPYEVRTVNFSPDFLKTFGAIETPKRVLPTYDFLIHNFLVYKDISLSEAKLIHSRIKDRPVFYEKLCINNIASHGDLEFLKSKLKGRDLSKYDIFETALVHGQNHILSWGFELDSPYNNVVNYAILQYGSLSLILNAIKVHGLARAELVNCLIRGRINLFFFLVHLDIGVFCTIDELGGQQSKIGTYFSTMHCFEYFAEHGDITNFFRFVSMEKLDSDEPYANFTVMSCENCVMKALENNHLDFVYNLINSRNDTTIKIPPTVTESIEGFLNNIEETPLRFNNLIQNRIDKDVFLGFLDILVKNKNKPIPFSSINLSKLVFVYGFSMLEMCENAKILFLKSEDYGIYYYFTMYENGGIPNGVDLSSIQKLYNKFKIKPTAAQVALVLASRDKEMFSWMDDNFDIPLLVSPKKPNKFGRYLRYIPTQVDPDGNPDKFDCDCADFLDVVVQKIIKRYPDFVLSLMYVTMITKKISGLNLPIFTKTLLKYVDGRDVFLLVRRKIKQVTNSEMNDQTYEILGKLLALPVDPKKD